MKIYITAPFWKENLESLKRDFQVEYASWFQTGKILEGQELADVLNEERAEIFVTEEDIISEEVLALVPGLKMVCVCRGTPSNVDMQAAGKHQIVVANTPGRNAVGVAELVIGMMIAVSRRMREGDHLIRTHQWKEDYYFHSFGEELEGKSCGFIGFGAVALSLIHICPKTVESASSCSPRRMRSCAIPSCLRWPAPSTKAS